MRNRWIRRLLILLALAAAAVVLRFTVFRPKAVPVTVFRAARGLVEDTVTNSKAGTIRTRFRSSLSPEIGGRVLELPVHEGDHVKKGQLLLRMADADYRAQVEVSARALEAARASKREACLARDQAEIDLRRNLSLQDGGIVSEEIIDQTRNRRDIAEAQCQAAQSEVRRAGAALTLARVNLAKTVLRAPFDGVVTEISTHLGEFITPSPPGLPIPPVLEIMDPRAIYVKAPLDEVDEGKVRVGLPVRITLDAYPGRSFMGKVTRVAPFVRDVEDQNRTFDVEVEFDDPEFAARLLPGTSADVEIILGSRQDALRIPSYALTPGDRVLVVKDGVLKSVPVKTGLHNWEFTEILKGLHPGDPVVVSLDRAEVKAGARARIQEETLR